MKSIRFHLSGLWSSLRLVVTGLVCALILFSNALPAYSFPNPFTSDADNAAQATSPTKGEDKLLGIEEGAQKTVIRQGDQDLLSGKNVQRNSEKGMINEVQGAADVEQMKNPSNAQGETIEGILQDRLEDATGK